MPYNFESVKYSQLLATLNLEDRNKIFDLLQEAYKDGWTDGNMNETACMLVDFTISWTKLVIDGTNLWVKEDINEI